METIDRLTFEPNEHLYHLDGRPIPSLTHLLNETGLKVFPEFIKDRKWYAERGTAVHRAVELYLHGALKEDTLDERIKGYLESFKKANHKLQFDIEGIELRAFDEPYWYACTYDLKVRLQWRDMYMPAMIDIKSGMPNDGDRYQTAGQAYTQPEFPEILRFCLYLKQDGSFQQGRDFIEHTQLQDYTVTQAAAVVYNAKRRSRYGT